jgi:uncharacterized Fe-S cluster-containing protein
MITSVPFVVENGRNVRLHHDWIQLYCTYSRWDNFNDELISKIVDITYKIYRKLF